ncbi:MAG: O-methyltransferase [Flavisolibacter sp.]|jgi:predicted O-methyltransferase YrrM|nr:O-methyltransferase [Flavisolibacter sp.]
MEITGSKAQAYVEHYTSPEDALLREVAQYTYTHHAHAQMLSGHLQGKMLEMISTMIRPKRILEIGTFTGYSALCMAKGLEAGGVLHTIELREDDAATATGYFSRSQYSSQIKIHIGEAAAIIGELNETWDLVFIDADKESYINYFNLIIPKVRVNGFILADNVLFHGQVLEEEIKGKNAKAIQGFNDFVLQRNDVEKLMLPVRDGVYILRKLH